ncbi:MAG: hypothetical protein HQK96_14730, partial [Nitrospirae bacterium]|nr:hypothetical protein [Nitrospirota bacterium]
DVIIAHELCYQLFVLGDKLTAFEFIGRHNDNKYKGYEGHLLFKNINNQDVYYILKAESGSECLWKINSIESNECVPFMFAKYVTIVSNLPEHAQEIEEREYAEVNDKPIPDKTKTTASFSGLANSSYGADLIGCLRMDVDDLGKLFSTKIKDKDFDLATLSYISRELNYFFKIVLSDICKGPVEIVGGKNKIITDLISKGYEERGGRYVSIVYSGGDDLFILGAWDETAELAFDIQKCFDSYFTRIMAKIDTSIRLTISAGLTLHKDKYPLYQIAKHSKEAEEEAKSFKYNLEAKAQKNKICLFYSPSYKYKNNELNIIAANNIRANQKDNHDKFVYALNWNEDKMFKIMNILISLCEKQVDKIVINNISRALVYKLFSLAETWWYKNSLYVPHLYYTIERLGKISQNGTENKAELIHQLRDLIIMLPLSEHEHNAIKYFKIPLTWFDLLLRNKGE